VSYSEEAKCTGRSEPPCKDQLIQRELARIDPALMPKLIDSVNFLPRTSEMVRVDKDQPECSDAPQYVFRVFQGKLDALSIGKRERCQDYVLGEQLQFGALPYSHVQYVVRLIDQFYAGLAGL
jgi:hypothetical protein